MTQNQENFYWLFSSSSQTISAFIAFLITGYALVLNTMQLLEQKDESLEEIHHELKKNFFYKIIFLGIITALAILFSLWMVYLNGTNNSNKIWLYTLTIILNICSIVFGIWFVLSIINPNRFKKVAKDIAREIENETDKTFNNENEYVEKGYLWKLLFNLKKN